MERKPIKEILEVVNSLEKDIGAPDNFFSGLLREDDWSFIIKVHALIEASTTHIIIKALEKPELEEIIARTELSNNKTGKIAYLKGLKLIESKYLTFIKIISEIRNNFVHNITYVRVTLKDYLDNAGNGKRNEFVNSIAKAYAATNDKETKDSFVKQPKLHIFFVTMFLLTDIYFEKKRYERELREKQQALRPGITLREFLSQNK